MPKQDPKYILEKLMEEDLTTSSPAKIEKILQELETLKTDFHQPVTQFEETVRKALLKARAAAKKGVSLGLLETDKTFAGQQKPITTDLDLVTSGSINYLSDAVDIAKPPFNQIITGLAKKLILRFGGLMPTFTLQTYEYGMQSEPRFVIKWEIKDRLITLTELMSIHALTVKYYEGENVPGLNDKRTAWNNTGPMLNQFGKAIPNARGIYFGSENMRSGTTRGVYAFRKFRSDAAGRLSIQESRAEFLGANSAFGNPNMVIELREGPKNKELGLEQDMLLGLVVQIAYLLRRQKTLEDRPLMAVIYRELNRIGAKDFDQSKMFGMESVLDELNLVMVNPLRDPQLAVQLGITSESVLLTGVPGTGKTLVGECLLNSDLNALFVTMSSARLAVCFSRNEQEMSDPDSLLVHLDIIRERCGLPVVLLIDDIEELVRDKKIVVHLLNLLQGVKERGFVILGSTNYPKEIDERLFEWGRFSALIYVPLPSSNELKGVFKCHTDYREFTSATERDWVLNHFATKVDGWSQRDVYALCSIAARFLAEHVLASKGKARPMLDRTHFQKAYDRLIEKIDVTQLREWDIEIQQFVKTKRKKVGFVY